MAESGIYEIVNTVNGKRYVGSAVWIVRRWCQHRHLLRAGTHYSRHLQRAWSLYGESKFVFRVLEIVAEEALLEEREQHYIDSLLPEYNLRREVAGSNLGVKWGAETIARMSLANREIWQRPGHREKMSAAHKGQKPTPEQIAKTAAKLRGRKMSPERRAAHAERMRAHNQSPKHRAKMSAYWSGRPKPQSMRDAISAAKRGKPARNKGVPCSAEQKAKQSEIMRRKYAENPDLRRITSERTKAAMADPAVREKCSRGNRGRVHSPEERAKRAASIKAAWARRKAANSA